LIKLQLNEEGEVKRWPHRTQLILVDYYDCQFGGYWAPPQTLLEWLRTQFARAKSGNVPPEAFAPLVVRLPTKHLTVRFFPSPGKPAYLTFEETIDSAGDVSRFTAIGLTPRQAEILGWVAQGKRDSEIAQIIHSSTRTASNHVYRILRKLGVETRGGAVAEAEFRLRRQS
jgi:DNA-binding CsgD family transcriptional regulator